MAHSPTAPSWLAAFAGLAMVAAVTGCEKRLASENIDLANKQQESAQQRKSRWPGISEGMTEKEVESILGQPSNRRTGAPVTINQPVEIPTVTYVYQQDGHTIELSFLDGKLQGRVPKFGEKIDPQAPLHMPKPKSAQAPSGGAGDTAEEDSLAVDLSGSAKGTKLGNTAFRRAVVDQIKEEAAELKAAQAKGEAPAHGPAQNDANKDQR
jgi:hypothetical protein